MTVHQRLVAAATFLLVASGVVLVAAFRGAGEPPRGESAGAPIRGEGPGSVAAAQEGPGPQLEVEPRAQTGMTAEQAIAAHELAGEGPEQPIPFNHRFHSQELLMQCEYCHGGTERSDVAVLPSVELCMGCHRIAGANLEAIQRLRGYWDSGEPVPWVQVYKVPEFVQFPHAAHLRNRLECEECHGKVEEMDRVYRFASLKMGWCLECHMGEGEDTDYATDRLLAERYPAPETPDERQPIGMYPRRIDQKYGAYRGPIDCFACHY